MKTVYLDTETTGLDGRRDRIVEIAIVGEQGDTLLNTLVNPGIPIPPAASRIHGITDSMVRSAPSFDTLWPRILQLLRGNRIVIYNAGFDRKFFPDQLTCAAEIQCAMQAYAELRGERTNKRGGFRWSKLTEAATHIGYDWSNPAHRALGDALACRGVWQWLNGAARQDASVFKDAASRRERDVERERIERERADRDRAEAVRRDREESEKQRLQQETEQRLATNRPLADKYAAKARWQGWATVGMAGFSVYGCMDELSTKHLRSRHETTGDFVALGILLLLAAILFSRWKANSEKRDQLRQ
jgi:DNA polymerase III epsilon subunit-like protein